MHQGIVSGRQNRTDAQVEARVQRLAGGFRALGIAQGDCVAILMRNDISFMEVTYGIMRLGAYAVPVNWHFKPEEIAYVLQDSGAKALIGHADLLNRLRAHVAPEILAGRLLLSAPPPGEVVAAYKLAPADCVAPEGVLDLETWLTSQPAYDGPSLPAPQSMIYTSGTTGAPKGVRRMAPTPAEEKATTAMRALIYGVKPGVRALLPGPLYHSAPNAFAVRAGRLGGVLVLQSRFDPEEFLSLVQDERIDTVFMVPTMFVRLLKLPEDVRCKYDISSLKFIIHAAAPCPPEVKTAMIHWWGPIIHEFYGGTETGPVSFALPEDALKKPGTVGRASPGAEIRIVDDQLKALPVGSIGEIYARIEGYPNFTYHNKPEKRAEVDLDGLVTCGDVGYLDEDGYLFICDRKRDMVISGGVNIYPAEIEAVLVGLEGVQDCAVFGVPDEEFGESLLAVVEPRPGVTLDVAALRKELAKYLADYKVPRRIEIGANLPREDSGKIFKRRLRDPYWEAAGRKI